MFTVDQNLFLMTGLYIVNGDCIARNKVQGYTYIGVLFMVTLMGVALALIGTSWKIERQRENEEELVFIGKQFIEAIGLYYERSPGGLKKYPNSLQDLTYDDRFPTTQRYLRKIYVDPMTLKNEWGILQAPEGGVMGVYSLSKRKSLTKKALFSLNQIDFTNAATVSEWHFAYRPFVQSYGVMSSPIPR